MEYYAPGLAKMMNMVYANSIKKGELGRHVLGSVVPESSKT